MEFELTSETSATASWVTGAELPTHRDNEKEYLAHRDISAVVWLNHSSEFSGGQFFYETDSRHEVAPAAGKGVFFRADVPHGVEKVTRGRRLGLLFWFTSTGGAEASEDRKILERGFPPFWSLTPGQRLFGLGPQAYLPIEDLAKSLEIDSVDLCRFVDSNAGSLALARFHHVFPVCKYRSMSLLHAFLQSDTTPCDGSFTDDGEFVDRFFLYFKQRVDAAYNLRDEWQARGELSFGSEKLICPWTAIELQPATKSSSGTAAVEYPFGRLPFLPRGSVENVDALPPGLCVFPLRLEEGEHDELFKVAKGELSDGQSNQAMRFGHADFPVWAQELSSRILSIDLAAALPESIARRDRPDDVFNQLIINQYQRDGDGICPHIDLFRFQDGICGVSLGAECTMRFRQLAAHKSLQSGQECTWLPEDFSGREVSVLLRPGSVYCLSGDSRYRWTHEIQGSTIAAERINITFRRMVQ